MTKRSFLRLLCAVLCWQCFAFSAWADNGPEFSTAGFYALPETGREVFNLNPAWRFHKGAADGAERPDFDDRAWAAVSLPNGLELLPTEASGCVNSQGEAWYRKRFTPDTGWQGRQLFLHFEAIMGQSRVWVNGQLVKEHFGGYLPVIADVTPWLKWGEENVIAVWTDNRDNPAYPPGKLQADLDFTYCGGIYRDCWLVVHDRVFITDPNYEDEAAGGGPYSLPDLMRMDVAGAEQALAHHATLRSRLASLHRIGLGYITLGEATTSLSGGEAQRLKLAAEMGMRQDDSLFVFDEPTIGLHPLDTQTLIGVFQQLLDLGATLVVIEHDLDIIANSDYVIDLGPGGGEEGGTIVAQGTPGQVAANPASVTGRYLSGVDMIDKSRVRG